MRGNLPDHAQHHGLWLTNGKPADGVTMKPNADERASALDAQPIDVTALHDPEQRAATRTIKHSLTALSPYQGQPHGTRNILG